MVANNRVHQESDEETRKENENVLQDGEENEHEQNDHENGIEDDAVISNDEQNVTNSENHGEQLEQQQQEEEKQERQEQQEQEQHEEEQQEGEVAEEVKLESLPEEVLDMIVNLHVFMTGHNQTIVNTCNALSHTSTKFKRLVSRYIKRLPKISTNRDMYPGLHSMRQILKQYGRGRGLVMALKETINSPQWINVWIIFFPSFCSIESCLVFYPSIAYVPQGMSNISNLYQ